MSSNYSMVRSKSSIGIHNKLELDNTNEDNFDFINNQNDSILFSNKKKFLHGELHSMMKNHLIFNLKNI